MLKKVLLFDDGKIVNLALMKASTYYKRFGYTVILDNIYKPSKQKADIVLCSLVFSKNKLKAQKLRALYPQIRIGGTGWDDYKSNPPKISKLPDEIEKCKPDYDLYTADDIYPRIQGIMKKETKHKKAQVIVDAGIGFSSRGCIRNCGFCVVPKKEGKLQSESAIKDMINPRSNVVILMDNNLTADSDFFEKLKEIKERNLVVDISSGIDVRLMTPEKAKALSEVKMLRSLHYAWDFTSHEKQVMRGINILSKYVNKHRHMCFMIVGYNSSYEEDMYRFCKLTEIGVDPYVMVYNEKRDIRLHHFARWVNSRIYKKCSFEEYDPWVKARKENEGLLFAV